MKMNSKGSVLMFCADFFGYDKCMSEALREAGYDVDLVEEKPDNSFVSKVCIRYNVRAYHPIIKKYIKSVIEKNGDKQYEYVFVVKGEAINEDALALLRDAYPKAKFILYLWDAVANIPDCEKRMKLYNRVLTFDPQDAKIFNLNFRPLFFAKEYEAQPDIDKEYRYDFAFIGTAHTVRPRIAKKLTADCVVRNRESFVYLFLPHPLVYLYNKCLNRDYRNVKKCDISFSSIDSAQIRAVYSESKCILDVEHQRQKGLTMRTIELVGMQKKIITTNALVKEYDFYNPNNIFVIDRDNPVVDDRFWDSPYVPVPDAILRNYSLDMFLREIFEVKEKAYEQ